MNFAQRLATLNGKKEKKKQELENVYPNCPVKYYFKHSGCTHFNL